jgi:hypothetical protein
MKEDEYYGRLEKIMVETARLYQDTSSKRAR